MKAIVVEQFGGPEVLRYLDVSDPLPGDGASLVRVRAVGVNPVDAYVRAGTYGITLSMPYVPGTEGAGEVLDGPRQGERVAFLGSAGPRMTGCYAELAAVRDRDMIRLPDRLSFSQGAAVPVAYTTAWRALFDRGNARPGERVLIHGASGGVGVAATQIASSMGCNVVGTASTAEGQRLVRECGATAVFNHKDANYLDQIRETFGAVDVIVEMLANVNLDRDLDLLAPGGRVVVVGNRGRIEIDPRKTMAKETTINGMALWAGGDAPLTRAFAAIEAGLARGLYTPVIDTELPLRDAARAHELILSEGTRGKVVLLP